MNNGKKKLRRNATPCRKPLKKKNPTGRHIDPQRQKNIIKEKHEEDERDRKIVDRSRLREGDKQAGSEKGRAAKERGDCEQFYKKTRKFGTNKVGTWWEISAKK